MSQAERGLSSPDIQIRPHHLITYSVKNALKGRRGIGYLTEQLT